MLFTTKQIESITSKVDLYHLTYIASEVGYDVLSKKDKVFLIKNGVDLEKYKGKITPTQLAYSFGKMESTIRDPKSLLKLNLKQYKDFYNKHPDVFKTSKLDRANIKTAKQQLYNDIMRAAGDIKADLHQTLIEASKVTQGITSPKMRVKTALRTISTALATNTKKYSSRFKMISGYNMHSAYQTGIAAELLERKGNCKCYFSVHPDACDHCKRIYLKNGKPKIFYLQSVINNGSNIGRKSSQWHPSLQPIHPHCRCKMNFYPGVSAIWSVRQNKYIRRFK